MDWTEEFNEEFQQQTGPNKESVSLKTGYLKLSVRRTEVKRMKGKKCLGFMRHHQ